MDTIYEVNKLARKATVCGTEVHAHLSPVVVTYTGGPLDPTALPSEDNWSSSQTQSCCKEKNHTCLPYPPHSSRLKRVARSSFAAETQAAADGNDDLVYIRLCLKEVLFGQLDLQNWPSEARQISAALVVDCRGVYDALARTSSSCLGLKDKKYGRLLSNKVLLSVAR